MDIIVLAVLCDLPARCEFTDCSARLAAGKVNEFVKVNAVKIATQAPNLTGVCSRQCNGDAGTYGEFSTTT